MPAGSRSAHNGFSRTVLQTLEAPGVRFDLVFDDYPPAFARVIQNDRHSVTCKLSGVNKGEASWEPEGEGASFGNLVFLPANVPIKVSGGGMSTRSARIEFDASRFPLVGQMVDILHPRRISALVDMRSAAVARLLQTLAREAEAPGLGSEVLLEGFGALIATEVARHLDRACGMTIDRAGLSIGIDTGLADQFIEAHLDRPISLKDIAGLYSLSERHVSRVFRMTAGVSVHAYVDAVRMKHAQRLLSSTPLPIKQIAFQLGYSGQASFSMAFRRTTGLTPFAFRRGRLLADRPLLSA